MKRTISHDDYESLKEENAELRKLLLLLFAVSGNWKYRRADGMTGMYPVEWGYERCRHCVDYLSYEFDESVNHPHAPDCPVYLAQKMLEDQ